MGAGGVCVCVFVWVREHKSLGKCVCVCVYVWGHLVHGGVKGCAPCATQRCEVAPPRSVRGCGAAGPHPACSEPAINLFSFPCALCTLAPTHTPPHARPLHAPPPPQAPSSPPPASPPLRGRKSRLLMSWACTEEALLALARSRDPLGGCGRGGWVGGVGGWMRLGGVRRLGGWLAGWLGGLGGWITKAGQRMVARLHVCRCCRVLLRETERCGHHAAPVSAPPPRSPHERLPLSPPRQQRPAPLLGLRSSLCPERPR